MGAFGEEEHQNDNFLDFVADNFDEKHLLRLLKSRYIKGPYIVGIANKLSPKARKKIPEKLAKKGISYLQSEKKLASEWRHPSARHKAINKQLKRMEALLRSKGSQRKSRVNSRRSNKKGSYRKRRVNSRSKSSVKRK